MNRDDAQADRRAAMTDADLPINARVNIWFACRPPARHIRNGLLETVSRYATHYALGGAIEALTVDTIAFRVGLQLHREGKLRPPPGSTAAKFSGIDGMGG